MERLDVFERLIDADESAQGLYNDALAHQSNLAEDLSELKKQLRIQMYTESDAYIAEAGRKVIEAADKDIAALNQNLQQSYNTIRYRYENEHQTWSDKMFSYAIINRESSWE